MLFYYTLLERYCSGSQLLLAADRLVGLADAQGGGRSEAFADTNTGVSINWGLLLKLSVSFYPLLFGVYVKCL